MKRLTGFLITAAVVLTAASVFALPYNGTYLIRHLTTDGIRATAWRPPDYGASVSGLPTGSDPADDGTRFSILPKTTTAIQLRVPGEPTGPGQLFAGPKTLNYGIPIPEPGTMFILGSGLVGLASYGRRRHGY